MAWDCRIGFRLNLFNVLILKVLLTQLSLLVGITLFFSNLTLIESTFVDCEEVHHCLCYRPEGEDWYEIQCPNKAFSVFPISVKVFPWERRDKPGEGTVVLTCDYDKPDFDWRLIRGLDLGKENQGFKITRVSIIYCPIPSKNDSLVELFKHINIDPGNIKSFSFTSHREIGVIPDDMMSSMVNLTDLDLGQNQLTSIPNITFFPNLKIFVLPRNSIESIRRDTFSANKQLQQIQLASNKISNIEDGSLPNSLIFLNLNTNKISRVTNGTFSQLNSLRILYLNQNSLEEMDPYAFSKLTQLKVLYLDSGRFKKFPFLDNLRNLENVSISYNLYYRSMNKPTLKPNPLLLNSDSIISTTAASSSITDLPSTVITTTLQSQSEDQVGVDPTTTTITSVIKSVNNNNSTNENTSDNNTNIAQVQVAEVRLGNLPSLTNLFLLSDGLMAVPVLENLPKLTSLILNQNRIQVVPPNAFSSLNSLLKLDLSRNEISSVGDIMVFTLTELDLKQNSIESIGRSVFGMLRNLKKLNLARNKIQYIENNAFESLTALEELDLSNNKINFASPQPPLGQSTSAYDEIFLKMGSSPLRFCRNLKTLNLGYNQISSIPNDFYTSMLQLTSLNLSHNKFTTFITQDLGFIQQAIDVDLSNNEISLVDMRYFNLFLDANAQNKVIVRLGGNPLYCDCALLPFKLFNFKSVEFQIDELRCSGPNSPKNLTAVKFLSVQKEDLVCPLAEKEGCPDSCSCWRRVSDMTVIVDCSERYNSTPAKFPNVNDVNIRSYPDFKKYEFILNMSGNGVSEIPDDYAKALPTNLRAIDLRGNNLNSLSFLKSMGDNNVTRFNLSDNPFPCLDCAFHTLSRSQFFRIWDSENLTCRIEESAGIFKTEKALDFNYESICSHQNFLQVFLPLFIIVCVFVIVVVFYIRHGWVIRAVLYSKGFGRFMCEQDHMDDDQEKIYDAFVSYSHQDEDWVLEELVNKLEEQEGYKCCIHTRDWVVGDWIPDQIVRSVDQSRRTVVILSKNFVESVWSRLEFKAAHSQALTERSNHLILILMGEDLTDKDVKDEDLKVYMKMNTYIKYNDPWFWHKLKYALPHRKCLLEENRNQYAKKVQRERAIKLDKMRVKLESQVAA